ncbi:hypothetical protein DY000_02042401 [Brassica cretica]|uniref:Uncharacterized protein n=1 Tax=Brassica cretica TaxID=69181 RepID=A0ABQ7B676_BRACR|nr:hypothetical protein DY000_02042401 [Brassica cretica]
MRLEDRTQLAPETELGRLKNDMKTANDQCTPAYKTHKGEGTSLTRELGPYLFSSLSHVPPLPLQRSDALAKGIGLLFFIQSYPAPARARSLRSDRAPARARSLRSDRAPARARSLRSDRAPARARSLRSDRALAWARSLRSDRALARARPLRSDRAKRVFCCCVAILFELLFDDSCFFRKAFRKEESITKKYLSKKVSTFFFFGDLDVNFVVTVFDPNS